MFELNFILKNLPNPVSASAIMGRPLPWYTSVIVFVNPSKVTNLYDNGIFKRIFFYPMSGTPALAVTAAPDM